MTTVSRLATPFAVETRRENRTRKLLLQELYRRQEKNPAFSLRAFSSRLGVSPSTLSRLLSGKRRITPSLAEKLARHLNLSPEERREFLGEPAQAEVDEAPEHAEIDADSFRLIADWFHYAILSLSEVSDARACPEWISRRLGILKREAEEAVGRLKALKIVEERDGKLKQVAPPLATKDDLSHPAIRRYVLQYMSKAEEALSREPADRLLYHTIVMATDDAHLEKARGTLKRFRRSFTKMMEEGRKERVYALSMQLFPIDRGG